MPACSTYDCLLFDRGYLSGPLCLCKDLMCTEKPAAYPPASACRFDGTALMHKFDIQAGHVTYRNRHLVTEMENYIREHNRAPSLVAYDDPCGSIMGRAFSTFVQAGMLQSIWLQHDDVCCPRNGDSAC